MTATLTILALSAALTTADWKIRVGFGLPGAFVAAWLQVFGLALPKTISLPGPSSGAEAQPGQSPDLRRPLGSTPPPRAPVTALAQTGRQRSRLTFEGLARGEARQAVRSRARV